MKQTARLVPVGHPNRPGTKLESLLAIVIHFTGNDLPTATDEMNAAYFGRAFVRKIDGDFEADGKMPFVYGSAHVIIDEDSVTTAIPTDEVAWACGDRRKLPWTPELRGQQPLARNVFGNRQNYRSVSVEICNNGDWAKAVANAQVWISHFVTEKGLKAVCPPSIQTADRKTLKPGQILIVRHYDLTGKVCPKPMVDDPKAWDVFVSALIRN